MAPRTQRALVQSDEGQPLRVIPNHPVPEPTPDHILVKVKAVTLNPTDWKHVFSRRLETGSSIGCDFAGDVIEIGSAAREKGFQVGDSVAGFIRGGFVEKENGAFQEYVKVLPEGIWHKPESLPYEDASSMGGVALSTAVLALLYRLGLSKPWNLPTSHPTTTPLASTAPTSPAPDTILIWAGSTSVGLFAIALAKLSNPSTAVLTTASPRNHALLKSLGADAVFDYRDSKVSEKIRAWAEARNGNGRIGKAFDCISEGNSTSLIADALGPEGGKIITLGPTKPTEGATWPSGVSVESIGVFSVLQPQNVQDFSDIQEWYAHLPALITERGFGNAVPLELLDSGLEGIPEGLERLRAGKISAKKLAYKL